MKIVFANSCFRSPALDSVTASFFEQIARSQAKQGHEVLVITLSDTGSANYKTDNLRIITKQITEKQAEPLRYIPVTAWSMSRALALYRLFKEDVTDFQPDVIQCVKALDAAMWSCTNAYPTVLLSVTPQFEIMRQDFDNLKNDLDSHLISAAEIAALNLMDVISAPSKALAQIISKECNIASTEIAVYPQVVETASNKSDLAMQFTGSPLIANIAGVEPYKGTDLLIEALPQVAAHFPNFQLIISGEEPSQIGADLTLADKLRLRLAELNLSHHVQFAGVLDARQRQDLLRRCSLSVFPFRYCGAMYHVAEAMSAGSTIVATNVGSIGEVVRHNETGYLAEPTAIDLAKAIIDIAGDKQLQKRLGENAQRYAQEHFCEHVFVQHLADLNNKAIERFKSRDKTLYMKTANVLSNIFSAFTAMNNSAHSFTSGAEHAWHEGYKAGLAKKQSKLSRLYQLLSYRQVRQ